MFKPMPLSLLMTLCVSVNRDISELLLHFMSKKNCSPKYVLPNTTHFWQANWIIFLKSCNKSLRVKNTK